MPPTTTPAETPETAAPPHAALALTIRRTSPAFASLEPTSVANGCAVQLGNWAIRFDPDAPPAQQFGRFGNCSARARCGGCLPICPMEALAHDLSRRCGGTPALLAAARKHREHELEIRIQSFVPGRPEQSDVWVPIFDPLSGQLLLVAADGARSARPDPLGRLIIADARPAATPMRVGARLFARAWQAHVAEQEPSALLEPGVPAAEPAGLPPAGRVLPC